MIKVFSVRLADRNYNTCGENKHGESSDEYLEQFSKKGLLMQPFNETFIQNDSKTWSNLLKMAIKACSNLCSESSDEEMRENCPRWTMPPFGMARMYSSTAGRFCWAVHQMAACCHCHSLAFAADAYSLQPAAL